MNDAPEWQQFYSNAVWLKRQHGDIDGAIVEMRKAIQLIRVKSSLMEVTANKLNYLADLYLLKKDYDLAESTLLESISLCFFGHFAVLGDNLLMLSYVQFDKGDYLAALTSAESARCQYKAEDHDYGVGQAEILINKVKEKL